MTSILVHVVTFNSPNTLGLCLRSILAQKTRAAIDLIVTDNRSSNSSFSDVAASEEFAGRIEFLSNKQNLGFCGAHNQAATKVLQGSYDYFLIINPDLWLAEDAIENMLEAYDARKDGSIGLICPKLLRCASDLTPLSPPVIDAAGMCLTPTLRHFDRGSGEVDAGKYASDELVFGGSGAALMIGRRCLSDLLLDGGELEQDKFLVYPQLEPDRALRAQLFDEAFFAYREDADLAWRAQHLGWRCLYASRALGYHLRLVLPENRASLPAEINLLGVRNRFLLQLNNFVPGDFVSAILPGFLWRNLVVVLAVLLVERKSIPALKQVFLLARRALARRRKLLAQAKNSRATRPAQMKNT